jgi:lysozyme
MSLRVFTKKRILGKILLFVGIGLVALLGGGYKGYSLGYWRFNHPGQAEYPVRGIDLSHHQGIVDWNTLRNERLAFAYIKATEGGTYQDPLFTKNWEEAKRIGLARGAYHFFTFCRSGEEQAKNFISTVPVDVQALPPAIDFEFAGNCDDRPQPAALLKELTVFIKILERTYRKRPLLYAGYDSYNAYLKGNVVSYNIWMRDVFRKPHLPEGTDWTLWQYAENGHVNGIEGLVDLDVFNGSQPSFDEFADGIMNP